MNGVTLVENFIDNPEELFHWLVRHVNWDERMKSRKTASFGRSYDYSQITYSEMEFPSPLDRLIEGLESRLGFRPNNCLANYYLDGRSKMGFHSDRTDILAEGTGVAIISVGATRTLRFRNVNDFETTADFQLTPGSLFYMSCEVQEEWQHGIPKGDTDMGRISLTFRKIK